MSARSYWSFFLPPGSIGKAAQPSHQLSKKGVKKKKKRGWKKPKFSIWVSLGGWEGTGMLWECGSLWSGIPVRRGLETSKAKYPRPPPKYQPPAISSSKPAPSLEFTPALHLILEGWQESEKGESR